jgi:prepilin-type N-terminal cleavage/methylation domain-containing protein
MSCFHELAPPRLMKTPLPPYTDPSNSGAATTSLASDMSHHQTRDNSKRRANGGSRGRRGDAGFTLVEVLVVLAVIALLLALLFPQFESMRQRAAVAKCMNHQKQIATALVTLASENNGRLPDVAQQSGKGYKEFWFEKVSEYMGLQPGQHAGRQVMRCPAAPKDRNDFTYGINYASGPRRVFAYMSRDGSLPNWMGSQRLSMLSAPVILIADAHDPNNPDSSLFYSPLDPNYPLTADRDKDGVLDSASSLGAKRKFNCLDPRHGDRFVCVLVDCSARLMSVREWAENPAYWGPSAR